MLSFFDKGLGDGGGGFMDSTRSFVKNGSCLSSFKKDKGKGGHRLTNSPSQEKLL